MLSGTFAKRLVVASSLLLFYVGQAGAQSGVVDIATEPMFTRPQVVVKPNLMFIMDNSGSMSWDYMPDEAKYGTSANNEKYGRRSAHCNGLGYKPGTIYELPKKADGTSESAASTAFLGGAAPSVSYNFVSGAVGNLTRLDLVTSPATHSVVTTGPISVTVRGDQSSYYKIGGVVTLIGSATDWRGNTYLVSDRYIVGKIAEWSASTNQLKIQVAMAVGSGTMSEPFVGIGSPIDNVYYVYKGDATANPPLSFKYTTSGLDTSTNFYAECNSEIGGPNAALFDAVIVTPSSTEAQNYANWQKYYSVRMWMMRTGMSRAFAGMDDKFRVGLSLINYSDETPALDIADFDSTQKSEFYRQFNSASPSGNTPLRRALARVGRYYANKATGQSRDPVQYSCQKNFAILSTDGYWNSSDGYQLDGTSLIGQQDGGSTPRPQFDGRLTTTRLTEKWDTIDEYRETTTTRSNRLKTVKSRIYTPTKGQLRTFYVDKGSCGSGRRYYERQITSYDIRDVSEVTTQTEISWEDVVTQRVTETTPRTRVVETVNGTLSSDITTAGSTVVNKVTESSSQTMLPDVVRPPDSKSLGTDQTSPRLVSVSNAGCLSARPADHNKVVDAPAVTTAPVSQTLSSGLSATVKGTPVVTKTSPVTTVGAKTSTTSTTSTNGSDNSLADAAMYYYATDLRTTALGNCGGPSGRDLCKNNVPKAGQFDDANWQHMTTYSLSVGQNGILKWDPNYQTQASGDFADLRAGSKDWPVPSSNAGAANIDDLWHAAVNGRGKFFTASDPDSLSVGLNSILSSLQGLVGSASAAATSSLEPVAGDNGVYVASFKSVDWTGDLRKYEFIGSQVVLTKTASDGTLVDAAKWSAADQLQKRTSPRSIYFAAGAAGALTREEFTYSKLSSVQKAYFDDACSKAPALSQCGSLSAADLAAVNSGANLVEFLRGNVNPLFRNRAGILGDIVSSSPVYVGKPPFKYSLPGYSSFVAAKSTRAKVVLVGANDGMLHAFDEATGEERWAYVPGLVMSKLYRLADRNYESKHTFTVDGSAIVADVSDANGVWRTIVVVGLNAGGVGYFALDITDPVDPKPLWEYAGSGALGLTFSNPIVTRRSDGRWIVAFASGYNSGAEDRMVYIDANTGVFIDELRTGASVGLSKLSAWVEDGEQNIASRFYAGDLAGGVWRFDIDGNFQPASGVLKLASLVGPTGAPQPVTTQIQVAELKYNAVKYPVLFVGTGKYLGSSDISTTAVQSIYAFKDPLTNAAYSVLRDELVEQTLAPDVSKPSRRVIDPASPKVDWAAKSGWYVDLPAGERVDVDMQISGRLLKAAGNLPGGSADECEAGKSGTSWLYELDVISGKGESNKLPEMVAGLTTVIGDTGPVTIITGKGGAVSTQKEPPCADCTAATGARQPAKRSSWRELTN
ncbi:type IV pilus assembly protein PilY1 [Inhella inkyongensis]|uniref:Type IV pilus assembly protein PilY1 n=1 Tax=Inhella inkyongensis TaxID=392593 RepID=A0A840S1B1_9BURK|nr:PilC/PilY family type IV pilus protein [Inhella inkyongensis]MBB5203312.1 type IV pilus assembly protein PilY1 [Inhella inkyongensis]